jgi:EAL domain-containing protein (putative c-di-GMP-specific phosphodiesterase class I)
MQNMNRLLDYGVSFSLDDFGNGESNLNYIVDMPVQIVKFDRDMTKSYFEKSKGKLVMETATGMILDMGLKIVSEGVETIKQLEAMKKLGVQYIQGFYFSRPLP